MDQQIKSNNKNNTKETNLLPIQVVFQANIFKYVQKKKREFSVFAANNIKKDNETDKNKTTLSNLINRNTSSDFYQGGSHQTIDNNGLFSTRIKLSERRPSQKGLVLKRKDKGHKSSLSDWRCLYDQREEIVQRHEVNNNSPGKMSATDRLFYPSKRESHTSVLQKCCPKQTQKLQRIKEMRNSPKEKDFVSDQNFIHMYHRSVTPIASNFAQKKRIVKYLKENKDRRQSRHGLRLMNEAILSEISVKDVGFLPYKDQPFISSSKLQSNPEQCLNTQKQINLDGLTENRSEFLYQASGQYGQDVSRANRTQLQKFLHQTRHPKVKKRTQQTIQINDQNPEALNFYPGKQGGDRKFINLSELFSCTINPNSNKKEQNTQIRLKLFKPRQNKIQKGIFNAQNAKSENKITNFQYSLPFPQEKNCSMNLIRSNGTNWVK